MATVPAKEDDDVEVKVISEPDIEIVFEDAPSTKVAKQEAEETPVVAEAPQRAAKIEQQAAPKGESKIPDDEGIESLRNQLAEERRRREEATKRASESYRREQEADRRAKSETERREQVETEAANTRLDLIMNAIDSVKQQGDSAERDYRLAMETADYAAAAKAQRAMANAESKLTQLDAAKSDLESTGKRQSPTEGRVTREETRQDDIRVPDQVEVLAARLSPSSAAWVRSHPECVTDPVLNSEMIAAHNRAVRNGISVDSDGYFEFIESRLGISGQSNIAVRQSEKTNGAAVHIETPAPQPQRRPSVAAPVSRDIVSNSGSSSTPRTYTLTSAEREFCDLSDGDNENRYKDYAKSKLALAKEGKLSNNRLN